MITTLIPTTLAMPPGAPRSPGIHESSIIRCIAAETGVLDRRWVEELSLIEGNHDEWWAGLDEDSQLRMAIGMAWDEWYIPRIPNVVPHPGELCVDGVYMTPDGESVDVILTDHGSRHVFALHEVKTTSKSIKTVAPRLVTGDMNDPADLETQLMWLWQVLAYCKGMKTLLAYLHVLFLYGDYTYPMRPRLLCWRLQFTQEEVDYNWSLLTDYVRERS